MAYHLTFTGWFNNRQTGNISIEIYRKDVVPDSVVSFDHREIISVAAGYPIGAESKYNVIISQAIDIGLRVRPGSVITAETFLTDYYDEWKVVLKHETIVVFAGFIEPSAGEYVMKDPPYEFKMKCTDGLGLLKGVPLSKPDETVFTGNNTLLSYITAALGKTNLDLPIRIYCSIYESSMNDRTDDPAADMFQQTKLECRTFLKNAIDFVDCYQALTILFTEFCSLYQWQGRWIISSRTELQSSIGPTNYYTEYDVDGNVTGSGQDISTQVNIGATHRQHPITVDQLISYQVPAVSAKHIFNFEPWPELPKNNKFERGDLILLYSGNVYEQDQNGDDTTTQIGTYSGYTIDDWVHGGLNVGPTTIANLPALSATSTADPWRRSTYNSFGDEIFREIILSKIDTQTQVLQSEGIPVTIGDKVRISFDFKLSFNFNIPNNGILNVAAVQVYIVPAAGGTKWWWRDGAGIPNKWRLNGAAAEAIFVRYDESADDKTKVYTSISLESRPIPVDGTLYIQLCNVMDDNVPNEAWFKNFSFEYLPFIAGGYLQIKGDYWITAQNKNIKDTVEEEVFLSDTIKRALKGCLLLADGTSTTPTWYRYGIAESRHFKEILNLARFSNYYRRYRKISGTFRGLNCSPDSDNLEVFNLCFHRHFKFVDNDLNKLYVLVPPLRIDYATARFEGIFLEVVDTSMTTTGAISASQVMQYLILLINNTTEAEWNSASGAPPSGTPYFPPFAAVYPAALNTLVIRMDAGNNVTVAASDGGAGNSPSLTITSNTTSFIGYRNVRIQVGSDVQVGNIFTITIYGHDVTYVANTPVLYTDSVQEGDRHEFKYIYE